MFVLVEMVDTVRIPPWVFDRQLNDAIAEELNKKLANKVVYSVGLCICLYDITKLEDSYIFPGDGASHTKVHFRFVVFHPFLDEILVGKIKYCSQEGVHGDHLRARTGSAVLVEQLAPQRRNKGRRGATESRRSAAADPVHRFQGRWTETRRFCYTSGASCWTEPRSGANLSYRPSAPVCIY
ncbi:DNA-directed RNA polymerase III subunit RPC8 isoform X2 [Xiphophorus hellerii]|uniref:DNA-directed RNA polymerase III subunit RPC8 isoform X2 n=1 Tax=Xiphophorus hellerii TaxID=8084 RepID=UPI0013B3E24C|nr:DNA-directed RNA polymerase III subunit RPC8 isoform X2 [Xiphophorus hellerii]